MRTDCKHSRITGKPETIDSSVGLVPTNALVLTGLATFRVVGYSEAIHKRGRGKLELLAIQWTHPAPTGSSSTTNASFLLTRTSYRGRMGS